MNVQKDTLIIKPFEDFADFDSVVCFDENGSASSLLSIQNQISSGKTVDENRRYFTLTCCYFTKSQYEKAEKNIAALKAKHFSKQNYPVVLHTRDISKRVGHFNFESEDKYACFITDLSNTIEESRFKIISITFDLYSYAIQKYKHDPYEVAFDILLETLMFKIKNDEKVALVFEARGLKEDRILAEHIYKLIYRSGTKKFKKEALQASFKGVFFNHKTSRDGSVVYSGLELANLYSYPIYRYMRFGTRKKDFDIIIKNLLVIK